MSQRAIERARHYFHFLERNRLWVYLITGLLTLGGTWFASRLELRTDFAELLPERLPSVKALNQAAKRMGGTGLLLIGVESPSFEANRRFVEDMAERLRPLEGSMLRYFEYRYTEVRDFAEKFGLHYLTDKQLADVKRHIGEEIESHKDQAVSSFLGLDDEAAKKPAPPKDWLADLDPNFRAFLNYRDAYLSADKGKTLVIALRPKTSSLSISEGLQLTQEVRRYIAELNPAKYHAQMHVDLAGNVQSAIDEFDTIRHDVRDTALLLVILIIADLFLFFWSKRFIVLLIGNLIVAVAWTFGITQLHIGYLNTQTAFLGSLVAGTGINYGIILLMRYIENRKALMDVREALIHAMGTTAIATLIAALTTSISFASLFIANNKGFSQFGFIGGLGIVLCWIVSYTVLPLLLYDSEIRFPRPKGYRNPLGHFLSGGVSRLGNLFTRRAPRLALILGLGSAAGILLVKGFLKDPWEYNFDNLRNKISKASGTEAFENRIARAFPKSLTPSLVLLDSEAEAKSVCPAVEKIRDGLPPQKRIIDSCVSLYELLPKVTQLTSSRRQLMSQIQTLLGHRLLKFSDHSETYRRIREKLAARPPELKDLPQQLVQRFRELDGKAGLIAFVNPDSAKPLNDGRNMLAYTDSLAKIPLAGGRVVSAAGDSFILADLLREIQTDGPRLSFVAFAGAILIAVLLCGGLKSGFLMVFCLSAGTWWMLACQSLMHLKFNFFNFIALPLTFGIGVDYPINVFIRCQQERFRDFGKILLHSGTAVFLCSSTTIIGYYTLLGASSQALVSFGKLAIIGEFTCLAAAFLLLPALLRYMGHFSEDHRV